jgi:hypothetical protein
MSNDRIYTLLYKITPRSQLFAVPVNDYIRQQINITKTLLLRAVNYCRERGAKLVILSIPQQFQVLVKANKYNYKDTDVEIIDRIFSKFAAANGFNWVTTLIPLSEKYLEEREDLYYRFDGHLNNRGNEFIGRYFSKKVIDIIDRNNTS